MNAITGEDAAYLAGLIDGEGCVGATGTRQWTVTHLTVLMTDLPAVAWAYKTTGVGRLYTYKPDSRPDRKPRHEWKVSKTADAADVLRAVLPYMKVKTSQARAFLALAHLRAHPKTGGRVPFPEIEKRFAGMITRMKREPIEGFAQEALDLAVYLRQLMFERDGK